MGIEQCGSDAMTQQCEKQHQRGFIIVADERNAVAQPEPDRLEVSAQAADAVVEIAIGEAESFALDKRLFRPASRVIG